MISRTTRRTRQEATPITTAAATTTAAVTSSQHGNHQAPCWIGLQAPQFLPAITPFPPSPNTFIYCYELEGLHNTLHFVWLPGMDGAASIRCNNQPLDLANSTEPIRTPCHPQAGSAGAMRPSLNSFLACSSRGCARQEKILASAGFHSSNYGKAVFVPASADKGVITL